MRQSRQRFDEFGRTALWNAALDGNVKRLQRCLDAGADPNVGDFGRITPLFIAAYHGRLEAVKLLLERGADPNLVDADGLPPLHYATTNAGIPGSTERQMEIVSLLLQHGADPDHKNKWGVSPRDMAKDGGPALRKLFAATKRRSARTAGPGRRAPTPREANETAKVEYWAEHARLWEELVPPTGPAKTVQGEVIRIVGALTREAYTNGNVNWDGSHTRMWRFVARTLDDSNTFTRAERLQIKEWVRAIIRDRRAPDVSGPGSPYYLVTEKAVAWVLAHPKPIRNHPADEPRERRN